MDLYRAARHGRVRSVAIGSSHHQLGMLAAAGRAVILPSSGGVFDEVLAERLPSGRRAAAGGERGWSTAILELLGEA
jgi:hypothetical protein